MMVHCLIVNDRPLDEHIDQPSIVRQIVKEAFSAVAPKEKAQVDVQWLIVGPGHTALEVAGETILSQSPLPDIIMCDCLMPFSDDDGPTVLSQLRGGGYCGYTYIYSGIAEDVRSDLVERWGGGLLSGHGRQFIRWRAPGDDLSGAVEALVEDLHTSAANGLPWFRIAQSDVSWWRPLEIALKLLSALYPFGLLWEHLGSQCNAAERLQSQPSEDQFESDIQAYMCTCVLHCGARCQLQEQSQADTQCGPAFLHQALLDRYARHLKVVGRGDAGSVVDHICRLSMASDLSAWLTILSDLRDAWLHPTVEPTHGR